MRRVLAALAVTGALTLTGCQTGPSTEATSSTPVADQPATSTTARATSGLDPCALETLPEEAAETVDDIQAGGPFQARKDGSTFGNRERILPLKPQGFYREYTVQTPGSSDRGARRVVTGGNPKTDPTWYFYTDDHYDSFCQITGTD